jgi:hemoglobin
MARSMFDRYGGFARLSKVVMAFYDKALDSDVIGAYFEDVDMRRLVDHQTKFIASVMGGPASYTNETLRQLHARLHIHDAAFDEMVMLLEETLEDFDFAREDIEQIMADMNSRRPYIVSDSRR